MQRSYASNFSSTILEISFQSKRPSFCWLVRPDHPFVLLVPSWLIVARITDSTHSFLRSITSHCRARRTFDSPRPTFVPTATSITQPKAPVFSSPSLQHPPRNTFHEQTTVLASLQDGSYCNLTIDHSTQRRAAPPEIALDRQRHFIPDPQEYKELWHRPLIPRAK